MTDEELMRAALDEAKIAADLGEVPVGAVVAKDGEIVARAHNLRESGKNATYHAELMAIDAACKALGGWRLWQCELFVTLEPCPMCSGAIINSRLKRVVYGARDPKAGCCGSLTDLFALPFNHHPVIESGLLEDEAQALLQDFFVMLREKRKKKERLFPWPPLGGGSARRRWGREPCGHPKYFGSWQGSLPPPLRGTSLPEGGKQVGNELRFYHDK